MWGICVRGAVGRRGFLDEIKSLRFRCGWGGSLPDAGGGGGNVALDGWCRWSGVGDVVRSFMIVSLPQTVAGGDGLVGG